MHFIECAHVSHLYKWKTNPFALQELPVCLLVTVERCTPRVQIFSKLVTSQFSVPYCRYVHLLEIKSNVATCRVIRSVFH